MKRYTYYIALGSNIGDKENYLNKAIEGLSRLDDVYEVKEGCRLITEPWGNTEQDEFLNSLCVVVSSVDPLTMLESIQEIERQNGRNRHVHWGPRTLDLDIVWIEDESGNLVSVKEERLVVPHPYFWDRTFVLYPLQSVYPSFVYEGIAIGERIAHLEEV